MIELAEQGPMNRLEFSDLILELEHETVAEKPVEIVVFKGRVTNANSHEFNRKFYRLYSGGVNTLILVLDELEYINSTGIAILFSIFYRIQEISGKMMIAGLHPFLKRVFSLMDLPADLKVYETIEEAKASIE